MLAFEPVGCNISQLRLPVAALSPFPAWTNRWNIPPLTPWSFPDLLMLPHKNAQSNLLTKAVSLHGVLVQQAKAQDRVLGGKSFKHPGRDETWWPAAHPYRRDARVDDQRRCRWQLKKRAQLAS